MMLQHDVVAQHVAEDRGGLVDDGGERDGVDDPLVAVRPGVVEGEAERGERLAAAGRHGQREEAGRIAGARTHMIEDFGAQAVDRASAALRILPICRSKASIETGQDGLQRGPFAVDLASLDPRIEPLGVLEIGIDEAGEDHPPQEGELKCRFGARRCLQSRHPSLNSQSGSRPVTSGAISVFQTGSSAASEKPLRRS